MRSFNRVDKLIDELKDMDKAIDEACTTIQIDSAMESANHFLLRHIAINTAIIADFIDRKYLSEGVDDV